MTPALTPLFDLPAAPHVPLAGTLPRHDHAEARARLQVQVQEAQARRDQQQREGEAMGFTRGAARVLRVGDRLIGSADIGLHGELTGNAQQNFRALTAQLGASACLAKDADFRLHRYPKGTLWSQFRLELDGGHVRSGVYRLDETGTITGPYTPRWSIDPACPACGSTTQVARGDVTGVPLIGGEANLNAGTLRIQSLKCTACNHTHEPLWLLDGHSPRVRAARRRETKAPTTEDTL